MRLRVVDLFAGIGGFRLASEGLRLPGIEAETVAWSEVDGLCRNMYGNAFGAGAVDVGDVRHVYTKTKTTGAYGATRLPNFDVLCAGFPCQPFANIGQKAGFEDPRGSLFFNIVEILKTYQPPFFVLENVQKLRNLNRGEALDVVMDALDGAGYETYLWDLCASEYGVPQFRRRYFFVGVRRNAIGNPSVLKEPKRIPPSKRRHPTTWHLLERRMPTEHLVPEKTRNTVLRKNPKWQGHLEIDLPVARPLTASMHKWHRANQDNYFSANYVMSDVPPERRPRECLMSLQEPIRRPSPLEALRMQGFPDGFERLRLSMKLKFTPSYRMIGNAVPVPLARAVLRGFLGAFT